MRFAVALALVWRTLQPGVEYTTAGTLHVVRVDPSRAKLRAALSSELHVAPQTAGQWCRRSRLAVAINLGMFQTDQRSNVGYARNGKHLNNGRWNDYRAAVAIDAKRALWVDLDQPHSLEELQRYDIVVQNLRLIAGSRRNVWAANAKKWSEAALAIDSRGRLLFLFSRVPYSMRELNAMLLALPLDVTQAMHLEGGPEASLSIHAGGVDLDLCGSFETGFTEHDENREQWPIPNVLGVVKSGS